MKTNFARTGGTVSLLLWAAVSTPHADAAILDRVVTNNGTATPAISLVVNPAQGTTVFAVEEKIPIGLTPANMSPGSGWDIANRKLKWGPYFDNSPRTFSYTVTGGTGGYALSGVGSFDGTNTIATGDSAVSIATVPSKITRSLGGSTVSLVVEPASTVTLYTVAEVLPLNVVPGNVSDQGSWDGLNRKITWGPFSDNLVRNLTYTACGSGFVEGTGDFDGIVVTTGTTSLNACETTHQLMAMAVSNGVFSFVLTGPVSSNYTIQFSSNLVNWLTLSTNTIPTSGSVLLLDSSALKENRRFYRALPALP